MLKVATKKKVILNWIKKRIDNNKNLILVINGQTGSGKTYSALSLAHDFAEMYGSHFSIENNVDFNFPKLLEKMKRDINKQPGTCFVFEEVGAIGGGASNQQWQSKANQFFSAFMQTSRHKRQVFIMTCPNFTNLQKSTRELCHMQMKMCGINTVTKLASVRPLEIQINETSGKMYMKKLRFSYNMQPYSLRKLEVGLPPKDMVENYEKIKTEFTEALNQKIIDESKPKLKPLTEKQQEWLEYQQEGLNIEQIGKKMGISTTSSYAHKKGVVNKGYSLEKCDFKDNSIEKSSVNLNFLGQES
jgi:hypothetical protein